LRSFVNKLLLSLFLFFSYHLSAQETLSLEECINFALKNNIKIQQGHLSLLQNKFMLNQRKASILPSVNGFATHGYSFGKSLDYTTNEYAKETFSSEYMGLSSDLTLFNGFRMYNDVKSSKYSFKAGQESFRDITDQVSMTIASLYLQILMNREQLKNDEDQVLFTQNLLDKARLMVQVGEQNISKEMELRAQLANDEMTLVESKNQLQQSYLNLKQALNWDLGKPLEVKDIDPAIVDFSGYLVLDITEIAEQFYSALPTVQKARNEFESSRYSLKSATGSRYPSLVLQSSLNTRYSSSVVRDLTTRDKVPYADQLNNNIGEQISFSLNIPLFNNLKNSYTVQSAKLSYQNSQLALKETEQKAKNTIYESWFQMNNAYKRYLAAENSVKAQQVFFEQTNTMFKEGLISYYDWQSGKNTYNKAQNAFLSAKYDFIYRTKVFDYYRGIPVKLEK
jgi:outer membrane protein